MSDKYFVDTNILSILYSDDFNNQQHLGPVRVVNPL